MRRRARTRVPGPTRSGGAKTFDRGDARAHPIRMRPPILQVPCHQLEATHRLGTGVTVSAEARVPGERVPVTCPEWEPGDLPHLCNVLLNTSRFC